jgi:hypothetical protein
VVEAVSLGLPVNETRNRSMPVEALLPAYGLRRVVGLQRLVRAVLHGPACGQIPKIFQVRRQFWFDGPGEGPFPKLQD